MINLKIDTLKPQYSEQVCQILFVHYIKWFAISIVIGLVNPQNGSWVLFTISRNSLYQGSLYQGLSVFALRSLGQGYLEGVGDIMLEKYYNRQPTPFSQEIMHLKWFF